MITGGVPRNFLIAVWVLADFCYLVQAPIITDKMCAMIEEALTKFHNYKIAITLAGIQVGKRSKVINNWHIPKLEFLQSVVSNIHDNGVAIQWSADVTECAHVTKIKNLMSSTNNQNYE
jgi:hypothetical protein